MREESLLGRIAEPGELVDYIESQDYGEVHLKFHKPTGLRAIVAIHSTKLGPALGGCRCIPYDNLQSAIKDAVRLGRGMSYKAAIAGLPLGGGKMTIIRPKAIKDRQAFFEQVGEFIDDLGGRYITSIDSGTQVSDMDIIATRTSYVAGTTQQQGDPSPHTAMGIYYGIKTAVQFHLDKSSLENVHVAIQGVGNVGYHLAKKLREEGAQLTVSDINDQLAQNIGCELGAEVISPEAICSTHCDVFSPCALGAVINSRSLSKLHCKIIAGSANNQLSSSEIGALLQGKNILYAPDFVINAGGLIYAATRYPDLELDYNASEKIAQIQNVLLNIFTESKKNKQPTNVIAKEMAAIRLR